LLIASVVLLVLCLQGLRWPLGSGEATKRVAAPNTVEQPLDHHSAAVDVLRRQVAAYRSPARADFAATWSPGPAAQLQANTVYDDLTDLGVKRLDLRYLPGSLGGVPLERRVGASGNEWAADVVVTWTPAWTTRRAIRSVVRYSFVAEQGAALVSRVDAAEGAREPLWLQGPLEVRKTSRVFAVATTRAASKALASDVRTAVRDVGDIVPGSPGHLLAYLPATGDDVERLLDSEPGSHDGIAAVAATINGAHDRAAPAAIILNPAVFSTLGRDGRHLVITHEATHVLTKAVTTTSPLWIAEGFADYVGVGAVDVPVTVAAGRALRQVDRLGPPTTLPEDADFSAGSRDLEATYELAWLAARLIAFEYGEHQLVAFYEAAIDDPADVEDAFVRQLGTTESEFTRQWRAHLTELARER
jgi:hypothetical protein